MREVCAGSPDRVAVAASGAAEVADANGLPNAIAAGAAVGAGAAARLATVPAEASAHRAGGTRGHLRSLAATGAVAPSGQPLRVVIVGTDPQVRLGLRALVEVTPDVEIVAEAADGSEAATEARKCRADLVLLDSGQPRAGGLADMRHMSQLAGVGMLTWVDGADLMRMAARPRQQPESGQLIRAVLEMARQRSQLSPGGGGPEQASDSHNEDRCLPAGLCRVLTSREREIMGLIAEGLSNRQIAERLVLSLKTVKNHICRIYQCIGVHNRTEAVRRWREL